jgi:hypothetical protein
MHLPTSWVCRPLTVLAATATASVRTPLRCSTHAWSAALTMRVHVGALGIVPAFVVGLVAFLVLLFPLTAPDLYATALWDSLRP